LRVSRRVATAPNESVKWWPVRFTKDGERFPCSFIRSGLARLQHDRPVCRFERRTTFLQRSWCRFRETTQSDAFGAGRRAKSCGNEMFAEKNGRKIYERFYRHSTSEDKKVKMRRPRKNCGRHRTISFPRLRFSCGSWIAAAAGRKLQKNLS
jgi:hypothetical protein